MGINLDELSNELKKLNVDKFNIKINLILHGISGVRASVEVEDNHNHHGRHLSTIIKIINDSSLNDEVKNEAIKVFQIIGGGSIYS